jgi:hypothetical protein
LRLGPKHPGKRTQELLHSAQKPKKGKPRKDPQPSAGPSNSGKILRKELLTLLNSNLNITKEKWKFLENLS